MNWPMLTQTFVSKDVCASLTMPGWPSCPVLPVVERLPKNILSQYPTDMLVLGDLTPQRLNQWRTRISSTAVSPKIVLEFCEPYWIMKDVGPMANL